MSRAGFRARVVLSRCCGALSFKIRVSLGVSGRLVGPAAFKAVEGSLTRLLVGSIPIHSRHFRARIGGVIFELHTYGMGAPCRKDHADAEGQTRQFCP